MNLLNQLYFFCYKPEAVSGFLHFICEIDWETLIQSCKFLSELELTLDFWAPIPREFIRLAFSQLCKLAKRNFDRAIFDSICQQQVSAFLFFYFYYHTLSVFPPFHTPPPPSPPFPSLSFVYFKLFSRLNSGLTLKF